MQDNDGGGKKSGGCFSQGCGTIVIVVAVALFIAQCGPALMSYFEGELERPSESQVAIGI